jgi:hypothetical protein
MESEQVSVKTAPEPEQMLFTAIDLRGRTVILNEKGLQHVIEEHREVGNVQIIKEAVEKADTRTKGNFPGCEKLWAPEVGPTRWMVAVVAYVDRIGEVITAFGSTKGPPRQRRL